MGPRQELLKGEPAAAGPGSHRDPEALQAGLWHNKRLSDGPLQHLVHQGRPGSSKDIILEELPSDETYRALADNLSTDNEDSLLAILNILCKLVANSSEFKQHLNKFCLHELKTKLEGLKYHKNKNIQLMIEDVFFLLN